MVKASTIYDKLRQIVAINAVYDQIVRDERTTMRAKYKDEAVL